MRYRVNLGLHSRLTAVLLACALLLVGSATNADSQQPPPNRPSPDPKKDVFGALQHWGVVTEITKTCIVIQFEKDEPRKFNLSETLRAGKIPKETRTVPSPRGPMEYDVSYRMRYRISDVRIGDIVSIEFAFIGGERICEYVCIRKRPGGRVPPLPEEVEGKYIRESQLRPNRPPYIRYDEFMNAWWDLEDKGIPYPEKFGVKRRWPTAPMPREVNPIN